MSALSSRSQALTVALSGAVVAALAASATPATGQSLAQGVEYCYGVARAGENQCGHAYGAHGCAGQSRVHYDMGDWVLVPAGTCERLGGRLEPAQGVNPHAAQDRRQG